MSSSTATTRSLASQLLVTASQAKVAQAQARVRAPAAPATPTALPGLADMAPDLAIRVAVAMAALHHGWTDTGGWEEAEKHYVVQRLRGEGLGEDVDPHTYATRWQVRCVVGGVFRRHICASLSPVDDGDALVAEVCSRVVAFCHAFAITSRLWWQRAQSTAIERDTDVVRHAWLCRRSRRRGRRTGRTWSCRS